jgi:Fibronectin type III domain
MRRWVTPAALIAAVIGVVTSTASAHVPRSKSVPFADAKIIVEVNATDGDAGLQLFLDGEGWRSVRIESPDGRTMLDVTPAGRLTHFGLTELFSESSEPPFTKQPLARFEKRFPEGDYRFSGTTIGGERLVGSATLSHDIPDGPVLVAPAEGGAIDPTRDLVIRWEPVTTPADVEIVRYQVIVEQEHPLRSFSVELLPDATSVTVPAAFFAPGQEYKFEVLAIEAGGNQTVTERPFTTSQ